MFAMIVQEINLKHMLIFILAKHETKHKTRNFIRAFKLEGMRLSAKNNSTPIVYRQYPKSFQIVSIKLHVEKCLL